MKRISRFCHGCRNGIFHIGLYLILMVCTVSCKRFLPGRLPTTLILPANVKGTKWVDWNVLFKPGTSSIDRQQTMILLQKDITDSIILYNSLHGTNFAVTTSYIFCPCDTLLYNFSAIPLGGSGQAAIPPPKTPPGSGGSGDAVQYVNQNNSFSVDTGISGNIDTTYKVQTAMATVDSNNIMAVMDTGLDSTLFDDRFKGLLWNDPTGTTIRNFQFFQNFKPLSYYFDDEGSKHGTAVTALALEAMMKIEHTVRIKPKVMVLKVLDSKKQGSTFSVSCALSYAVQKHATLVNASLGYYAENSEVDSVLWHYVGLCNTAGRGPIPILAAAGNLPGTPDMTKLCAPTDPGNELTGQRTFYPGSFSTTFSNVITVTGLQSPQMSCTYQNYSSRYVSVGVVTNASSSLNCCKFAIPFFSSGYEGSSFATPVVSGEMFGFFLTTPGSVIQNCLSQIIASPASPQPVTVLGRYISYPTP